jgi:DNA-binding GntR family transcriptional regulator
MDGRLRRAAPLSQQVHEALLERIATGRIGPGERAVVEHLAEQLGVSPTPVREALHRLMQDGLIDETSAGKFHVVSLTPEYIVETFQVRSALEGLAAELATPVMPEAHLEALRAGLREIDDAVRQGEYEIFARLDDSLHQAIRDAAGNAVLSREIRPFQIHIGLIYASLRRVHTRSSLAPYSQASHAEHKLIVEAMAGRDPQNARRAVEQHIRDAGTRYASLIGPTGEPLPVSS